MVTQMGNYLGPCSTQRNTSATRIRAPGLLRTSLFTVPSSTVSIATPRPAQSLEFSALGFGGFMFQGIGWISVFLGVLKFGI